MWVGVIEEQKVIRQELVIFLNINGGTVLNCGHETLKKGNH
jgi:hypothetical protein